MEPREGTGRKGAAVGIGDERIDGAVGSRVEAGVQDAVAVENGEAGAASAKGGVIGLEGGEIAANKNGAVTKGGDRVDWGVGRGVKVGVERAVRVQPGDVITGVRAELIGPDGGKDAADDGFTISGLESDGVNHAVGHGVKAGVDGAVGIEPGKVVAGGGRTGGARLHGGKGAASEKFTVGLESEGVNGTVSSRIITGVDGAVGIKPSNVVAGGTGGRRIRLEGDEVATNEQFAVGLESKGANRGVGLGVVGGVKGAVSVEAGDAAAGNAVYVIEGTTEDQFAVGLEGQREDFAIDEGLVGAIESAVAVEAGEIRIGQTGLVGEGAGDHDFTIGLDENGAQGAGELADAIVVEGRAKRAVALKPAEVTGGCRRRAASGLDDEGGDRAVGVGGEGGFSAARSAETGEVATSGTSKVSKSAGDDEFGIGLDGEGRDLAPVGGGHSRIEGGIDEAGRGEPNNMVRSKNKALASGGEGVETAASDDLTAGQYAQTINLAAGVGIEGGVNGAIGVEARDAVDIDVVGEHIAFTEKTELATGDDLAVALQGDGINLSAGAGVVRGVNGAVGVQPSDVIASGERGIRLGLEGRKGPGDDNFAVRLDDLGEHVAFEVRFPRGIHGAIGVQAGGVRAGGGGGAGVGRKIGEATSKQNLTV